MLLVRVPFGVCDILVVGVLILFHVVYVRINISMARSEKNIDMELRVLLIVL